MTDLQEEKDAKEEALKEIISQINEYLNAQDSAKKQKVAKKRFNFFKSSNNNERGLNVKEAFAVIKPHLDKGLRIMVAVDPVYAAKWVDNANVYAMASALKAHELRTYVRLSKLFGGQTSLSNWLKWLIPAGIFLLLLGIAIHFVSHGSVPAPPSAPHTGYNI